MLKFNSRYDAYAYRIGWFPVKDGVTIEEGSWVKLDANCEVIQAVAGDTKAYLAVGSNRKGRNQIEGKALKNIAFLHGAFAVETDQVEGSLAPMDPLKIGTNGKLTKATLPADAGKVVATTLKQSNGFTTIVVD